jgi:hypothetical protein
VRPQGGQRLTDDVGEHPHRLCPQALGSDWGPRVQGRAGGLMSRPLLLVEIRPRGRKSSRETSRQSLVVSNPMGLQARGATSDTYQHRFVI